MSKVIKEVNFRRTIPALTGMRIIRRAPITGIINNILVHFPRGCWGLVSLRFGLETGLGRGQVFPSPTNQWLALDNATKEFPLRESIKKGDEMWVEILNADAAWPHTPTVVVEIEGKERYSSA